MYTIFPVRGISPNLKTPALVFGSARKPKQPVPTEAQDASLQWYFDLAKKKRILTEEEMTTRGHTQQAGVLASKILNDIEQEGRKPTPEELMTLTDQIKAGNHARREIVEHNLLLVPMFLNQFLKTHSTHLPYADLLAAGNDGLMQAAKSYNPDKGAFGTIAGRRIIGEILTTLQKSTPSLEGQTLDIVSLDEPMTDTDDSPLTDRIADTRASQSTQLFHDQLTTILNQVMGKLPPKTQQILRDRYGLGRQEALTLEAVAQQHALGGKAHAQYHLNRGLEHLRQNTELRQLLNDLTE